MLVIPLIAATIATHSVNEAFGFDLGKKVSETPANCKSTRFEDERAVYLCLGDRFFDKVFVHTQFGIVQSITAQKSYDTANVSVSSDCFKDVISLLHLIEKKYPSLKRPTPMLKNRWERSEGVNSLGYAEGRTVSGGCEIPTDRPEMSRLQIEYRVSMSEYRAMQDEASGRQLRTRGLNPDSL